MVFHFLMIFVTIVINGLVFKIVIARYEGQKVLEPEFRVLIARLFPY